MTFGFATWRADGTPIITPADAGGVFLDSIIREPSDGSGTISFPTMNGRTLRVFQVARGCYTWATGVDGAGDPYLTLSRTAVSYNDTRIILLVFAV